MIRIDQPSTICKHRFLDFFWGGNGIIPTREFPFWRGTISISSSRWTNHPPKQQSSRLSTTSSSKVCIVSWISPETLSCTRRRVLDKSRLNIGWGSPISHWKWQLHLRTRFCQSFKTYSKKSAPNLGEASQVKHIWNSCKSLTSPKALLLKRFIQQLEAFEEFRDGYGITLICVDPLPHVLRFRTGLCLIPKLSRFNCQNLPRIHVHVFGPNCEKNARSSDRLILNKQLPMYKSPSLWHPLLNFTYSAVASSLKSIFQVLNIDISVFRK